MIRTYVLSPFLSVSHVRTSLPAIANLIKGEYPYLSCAFESASFSWKTNPRVERKGSRKTNKETDETQGFTSKKERNTRHLTRFAAVLDAASDVYGYISR